jgi:hypothetical protein
MKGGNKLVDVLWSWVTSADLIARPLRERLRFLWDALPREGILCPSISGMLGASEVAAYELVVLHCVMIGVTYRSTRKRPRSRVIGDYS